MTPGNRQGTQTCGADCQWSSCESINNPPYPENLEVLPESYCIDIPGCGEVSFRWVYQDIDGDNEVRFEFQVDDNSDFLSPEINRSFGGFSRPVGTINTQIILVRTFPAYYSCDYINYDTSYYWRVRVWDSTGLNSGWVEYNDPADSDNDGNTRTYTKDPHPYPAPEFSFIPANPVPGDLVSFIDLSVCYDNSNNPYLCKNLNPGTGTYNEYTWEFGDSSSNNDRGNTSHSYGAEGTYTARLEICDVHLQGLGKDGCCSVSHDVPVGVGPGGEELFEWREISPFGD